MGPRRLTDGGFKPGSPALWPWGGRLILTAGSNPMLWEQTAVVLGDVSWDPRGGTSHTDGGFKPAVVMGPHPWGYGTRGALILTAGSNPPSYGTPPVGGGLILTAGSNPPSLWDPGTSHTDGGFKPAVVMGPPWRGSHTDRGFKPAVVKPSKRTPWTRSRY